MLGFDDLSVVRTSLTSNNVFGLTISLHFDSCTEALSAPFGNPQDSSDKGSNFSVLRNPRRAAMFMELPMWSIDEG